EEELGTDPLDPDTDGGGIPDGAEVDGGTDPADDAGDDIVPTVDDLLSLDGLPVLTGTYNHHALNALGGDLQVTVDGVTYALDSDALSVDGLGEWTLDLSDLPVALVPGVYDVAVVQQSDTNPPVMATDLTSDELIVSLGPDDTLVTVTP